MLLWDEHTNLGVRTGSPRDLYSQKGQFYDMVCHSGESDDLQGLLDKGLLDE